MTGKGGVGKTTMAAALALQACAAGARVLAVDVVNSGDLAAAIASARTTGPGSIEVLGLTTQDSLNEYVRRYLKVPISPASIGPLSRVFDFVSNAAPGVKEILTVGKIGYEARFGSWDQIIVDAPASGHVVEMLAAPTSLHELISAGPLVGQTAWLAELLAGPGTSLTVVATAEELPVAETVKLIERLGRETDVAVDGLIVNRVPHQIGPAGRAEGRELGERLNSEAGTAVSALAMLAAAAVDRAAQSEPFVSELGDLAATWEVPVLTVAEDFADPVGAALAALTRSATGNGGRQ